MREVLKVGKKCKVVRIEKYGFWKVLLKIHILIFMIRLCPISFNNQIANILIILGTWLRPKSNAPLMPRYFLMYLVRGHNVWYQNEPHVWSLSY